MPTVPTEISPIPLTLNFEGFWKKRFFLLTSSNVKVWKSFRFYNYVLRSVLFCEEKCQMCIRNSIQIQDFGCVICTFCEKSTKIAAHSPTLKVGFAAEAILQGVMLAQYQQNIIVSFSLQDVTIFLSAVQCEISVAFFIFAKRCFPLSARGFLLLRKVA